MPRTLYPPSRRSVTVVSCVAVVAAIVAMLATRSPPADASPSGTTTAGVPVSVATVIDREVIAWSEHSGRFEAIERVELRARVAGQIQAVHFREGAMVKAGDLLVTIDPAPYAAEVQRAEAQLLAAQVRLQYAANEARRTQRLWNERAIAQRELDERVNAADSAEAELAAAEAALRSARLNLTWTQVRAPVAGRIGRLELTVGNLVTAGANAPVLVSLVSVHPIYAAFDADEGTVMRMLAEVGGITRATVDQVPVQAVVGDRTFEGRLHLVDNQVDARSGTVRMRALFDNRDGQVLPGQFAKLRLGQPVPRRALLVSERAVGTDQDKRYVFVVGADRKTSWREVTLGASVDGLRIVESGLEPGERIVLDGLQRVRPGVEVAPTETAMQAQPGGPARTADAAGRS